MSVSEETPFIYVDSFEKVTYEKTIHEKQEENKKKIKDLINDYLDTQDETKLNWLFLLISKVNELQSDNPIQIHDICSELKKDCSELIRQFTEFQNHSFGLKQSFQSIEKKRKEGGKIVGGFSAKALILAAACLASSLIQQVSAYNAVNVKAVKSLPTNINEIIKTKQISSNLPEGTEFPLQPGSQDYYENARSYLMAYMNIDGQCSYNSQILIGNDGLTSHVMLKMQLEKAANEKNKKPGYANQLMYGDNRPIDVAGKKYADTTIISTSSPEYILEKTREIGKALIAKFKEEYKIKQKNENVILPTDTIIGFSFGLGGRHAVSAFARIVKGKVKIGIADMNYFGEGVITPALNVDIQGKLITSPQDYLLIVEPGFFTEKDGDVSQISTVSTNPIKFSTDRLGYDFGKGPDEWKFEIENTQGKTTGVIKEKMYITDIYESTVQQISKAKDAIQLNKIEARLTPIINPTGENEEKLKSSVEDITKKYKTKVMKDILNKIDRKDGGKTKRRRKSKTKRRRRRKTKHIITI